MTIGVPSESAGFRKQKVPDYTPSHAHMLAHTHEHPLPPSPGNRLPLAKVITVEATQGSGEELGPGCVQTLAWPFSGYVTFNKLSDCPASLSFLGCKAAHLVGML